MFAGYTQANNADLAGLQASWVQLVQYKPRGKSGAAQFDEAIIAADVRGKLQSAGGVSIHCSIYEILTLFPFWESSVQLSLFLFHYSL